VCNHRSWFAPTTVTHEVTQIDECTHDRAITSGHNQAWNSVLHCLLVHCSMIEQIIMLEPMRQRGQARAAGRGMG
jgi:hypothetical protein